MAEKWYTLGSTETVRKLAVKPDIGLSSTEVETRRRTYGPNELAFKRHASVLKLLASQFTDVLIVVLIAAATISLAVSLFSAHESPIEAYLIYTIVVAIAAIGFFNEYKAERTVAALRKLVSYDARVLRSGKEVKVPATELVPGDIILLEEGQKVPADARLLSAHSLQVNEASLTGESAPQHKNTSIITNETTVLADQHNMVFSGTNIVSGTGQAVVVATGAHAEIGRIAQLVSETEVQRTPMQQKLDALGRKIGVIIAMICAVAFVAVLLLDNTNHGTTLQRMVFAFTAAVALAVAAIPEGLAFVVRISLALGARRMADRHALVRRLAAVESLGSTDVVCTDKTGTLTRGEMTVREIWQSGRQFAVTGEGYNVDGELQLEGKKTTPDTPLQQLLRLGVLANNAKLAEGELLGDPTELSLLVAAEKLGLNREELATIYPRVHEAPFSSTRKMMSTLHKEGQTFVVATKGAPEVLVNACTGLLRDGQIVPLGKQERQEILAATEAMTSKALRVLAIATREYTAKPSLRKMEEGLVLVGLVGIMDPPRLEVKDVITRVQREAGMRVVMITGDNLDTAKAIATELGIKGEAIAGSDLDDISEGALGLRAERIGVYARVNPEHKIRIVKALQLGGHQVAMTGDGVNDAPALKAADIGVAMGITGTDAAKEASDLILLDDQFKTIIAAIEEGRGIFDNMRKFINFLLSTNTGLVVVVLLGIVVHGNLLLSAAQLLFINIVTNGLPAIALGADTVTKGVMRRRPAEFQEAILTRRTWLEMMAFGALMGLTVLAQYSLILDKAGVVTASSVVFLAVVVYTFARLVAIRSRYHLAWFSNPWLTISVVGSLALAVLVVYMPVFADLFGLRPVSWGNWLAIILVAPALVLAMRLLSPFLRVRLSKT